MPVHVFPTNLPMSRSFDVLVLGAGAAGLFCAAEAGKHGRRVAVLERADSAGKKILISGGGRCNFTNIHCTSGEFSFGQSSFCQVGFGAVHPCGFHRAGGKTQDSVSRKDAGPAVLRPLGAGNYRAARIGVPRWRGADFPECSASAKSPRRPSLWCAPERKSFALRCWWWRRAGSRFRKWARHRLDTNWQGSLD